MHRWFRVGRGAPALALALAVGTAAACEPAPCDEPYRPVAAQGPPFPPDEWPVVGTPRPALPPPVLDTDGDGVADQWARTADGGIVIRRSSGTELVLDVPGDAVVTRALWLTYGDLDGDGRSDLTVDVDEPGRPRAAYLVPGALASGAHDPTEVGVFLGGPDSPSLHAVGDLDGDGRDDVTTLHRDGAPVADVWYGTDIWAGPPTGVLTGTPSVTYPGVAKDAFVAGPGVNGFITLERVEGDVVVIRLVVRDVVRAYTTEGSGVPYGAPHYQSTEVVDGPNGELWLTHLNQGRYGISLHAWDVANPCAGATAGAP